MKSIVLGFLFIGFLGFGQNSQPKEFSYNEFLGYVKKYHPMVKSAALQVSSAQANLMMARGGFDPKIEVDFEQKNSKTAIITPFSTVALSFQLGMELK